MKLFTSRQMNVLDLKTTSDYHIPTALLMEHSGLETARAVLEKFPFSQKVIVLCGPGNNGGDGFAASRILNDWGFKVRVFLSVNSEGLKGDALTQYEILKKIGIPLEVFPESRLSCQDFLRESDLVIDALFGTGLKRLVEGRTANLIQWVNQIGKPVAAVDIPSGIDSDTGKILGVAIKANMTVTLGAPKIGLYLYPGRTYAGDIKIAYIGIPHLLISESPCAARTIDKEEVMSWLPVWEPDVNKGERGRVMIIGGSRGLSGAPVLSAEAALHSGSGLVYLAVPDGIRNLIEHKLTDAVKVGLPQTTRWVLGKNSVSETISCLNKVRAAALGPGIGRDSETGEYVKMVLQDYQGNIVIDADALYPLDDLFLKKNGRLNWILTPHEGEMARLCGISQETVREQRWELAVQKAKDWNCILVLKGASTIVAAPEQVYLNLTGNPGIAVGGSGDVLTGLLASLLAQGMSPVEAACSAVFIHGRTGDLLKQKRGIRGITASLLAENLSLAFQEL
jgi:NAD(P)H-hydrate epimerase